MTILSRDLPNEELLQIVDCYDLENILDLQEQAVLGMDKIVEDFV